MSQESASNITYFQGIEMACRTKNQAPEAKEVSPVRKRREMREIMNASPVRGDTGFIQKGIIMRFMIMVKATKESETGIMPSQELLTAMGNYNQQLAEAGVLIAGEGLQPSSKGARVRFSGNQRTVIDGPFAETKELIAGFWIWQVKSKEEAIEWVKRCPNPMPVESEIEIRQIFEPQDFGAEFTPELREQEAKLRMNITKPQ